MQSALLRPPGVFLGGQTGQHLPTVLVDLTAQRLPGFKTTLRTQEVPQYDRDDAAVKIAREAEQMGLGQPRARLDHGRTRTHIDHRPVGLPLNGDGGSIYAVAQVVIGGHGNVGRRESPLPADAIAGHDRSRKRMEYHGLRQLVGIGAGHRLFRRTRFLSRSDRRKGRKNRRDRHAGPTTPPSTLMRRSPKSLTLPLKMSRT